MGRAGIFLSSVFHSHDTFLVVKSVTLTCHRVKQSQIVKLLEVETEMLLLSTAIPTTLRYAFRYHQVSFRQKRCLTFKRMLATKTIEWNEKGKWSCNSKHVECSFLFRNKTIY